MIDNMESSSSGISNMHAVDTKEMMSQSDETLTTENTIPQSMDDPSYTDSVGSADSRTALLKHENALDDTNYLNKSNPDIEPPSNHSSFWDVSDLGHEIEAKMALRDMRREREKEHVLQESIAYIDPLVPPSPDVNRLRSICRNAVQSLSQEAVYRSMSILAIDEKGLKKLEEDKSPVVDIEVEEIRYVNNHLSNLIFLSIGISLVCTAIGSLRNLLSSMHHDSGIGVYSLAASFGAFTVFSLISPFVVQRFRPKFCLVVGIFTQLLYVVANLVPTFYVFIPASFLQGMGNSLLWNAMSTYTSYLARASAIKNDKKTEDVASKYFGIFFFFYQFSYVAGNLISSLVLVLVPSSEDGAESTTTSYLPSTSNFNESQYAFVNESNLFIGNSENICGAKFCNHFKMDQSDVHVDPDTSGILIGIYGMCVVIALIVSHVLLDPIATYHSSGCTFPQIFKQVGSVFECILHWKFLLVTLVLMYSMMQVGFAAAEMTKAFVSCPLGIHMVGYTMIGYGVCGGLSSWISGILCQYVGRVALISSAACLDLALLLFMVLWEPNPEQMVLFFLLLGAWGVADGVWISQVNSIVSALFHDKLEDAFASLRVLQGLGGTIVFCYSNSLCVLEKMYILAAVCIIGTGLYIGVEISEKKRMSKNEESTKFKAESA
ncbi:protein unc-93 homolog A-like isoform X2 [Saccostrea echinata]|nr:protein unc-93 homolog A-like isoform X2 [Saccostrea echinata]